jgi:dipeptidyl aminopeptidase/acylaminoacyl peptidase
VTVGGLAVAEEQSSHGQLANMRQKQIRMTFAVLMAVSPAAWLLTTSQAVGQSRATESITRPVISESTSPFEAIAPVAKDGHRGTGLLRRPPGAGPFPALLWIHGGLATRPQASLREYALSPNPSRFLTAGYVVAVITYRSRDEDPQSTVSLADSLAAIDHLRRLPYVDPKSIVIFGCSGGGDLALEIAATTDIAAIAPEEPATMLFTGIFNRELPKKGARYTPEDGAAAFGPDYSRAYTAKYQQLTREKIRRIQSPTLIVQGDPSSALNRFNMGVFVPELRSAGKSVEVRTYPGEPHCFGFYGSGPRTPRPAAALKVFEDADAFFRRYLNTKPKSIDPRLVDHVPIGSV